MAIVILLVLAVIFFYHPNYFLCEMFLAELLSCQAISMYLYMTHLSASNTQEVYEFDAAMYGCHPQQTFFSVGTKESFSQIYLFTLNSLTSRFHAKVP